MPLKREDLDAYEGRFEFWDAATETAWVVREPTSAAHEHPSQRLSALGEVIAAVRGSPIECFGTMDLELRGEHGERWRILQADQSLYLHPARSRLPHETGMVVGEQRRGKLGLYEEWGFPEVWVEVPARYSPSRPAGRRAGLTIHLLEDGAYRSAPESRAFPGWTAEEIHRALQRDGPLGGHRAGARPGGAGPDFPDMVLEVDHTTSGHGSKARGAERDLFVGIPDDDAEEAPGRRVQAAPRKAPRSSRSGGTARRRQRRGIVEEPV